MIGWNLSQEFTAFALGGEASDCNGTYVKAYDGDKESDNLILNKAGFQVFPGHDNWIWLVKRKLYNPFKCGNAIPKSIHSTSNNLLVIFSTQGGALHNEHCDCFRFPRSRYDKNRNENLETFSGGKNKTRNKNTYYFFGGRKASKVTKMTEDLKQFLLLKMLVAADFTMHRSPVWLNHQIFRYHIHMI